MTRDLLAAVLTIVLMLSGCTLITASDPLGQPMLTDLQGTWHLKLPGDLPHDGDDLDEVVYLSFVPDGSLAVTWGSIGTRSDALFEINFAEVVFSAHKGALYLNFRSPAAEAEFGAIGYIFLRAVVIPQEPESFVLFVPRVDAFKDPTVAGRFQTETFGKEHIEVLKITDGKALVDFIDPAKVGTQFDVAQLGLLRRLRDFEQTPKDPALLAEAKQAHMACLLEEIGEGLKISRQRSVRVKVLELKQIAGFSASEIAEEIHRLESESAVEWNPVYVDRQSSIIEAVDLLESQFVDYQACMVGRGYTLVDDPARLPFRSEDGMLIHLVSGDALPLSAGEKPMWIAKNGFGLFIFRVTIKAEITNPAGEPK